MIWQNILIFFVASFFLVFSAKWVLDALTSIARRLGWKEFVVAFFTISLGAVAPEFFIGITSALRGVPELSFGNIVGQNILLFGLTTGICAIILKNGIEVESRTVRMGSTFAVGAAILPLLLIMDGQLSRPDGIILIAFFSSFIYWLFSRRDRFTKIYDEQEHEKPLPFPLVKNFLIFLGGLTVLIISSYGIVSAAEGFSSQLNISLPMVGLFIVAMGVGLPETYFSITLARRGQSWMILGGLMGAVTMSSTLVLGVVSLIQPIVIDLSVLPSLSIARVFLIACSLIYLFFIRSGRRLSTREGIVLVAIYFLFLSLGIIVGS
jgi:cation:H+ antiporter